MFYHITIVCPCNFVGEGFSFLSFQKGDLIQLESEDGEDIMNTRWCYGECERTKKKGDFPAECVYVLPAITKPPIEILVYKYITNSQLS